MVLHLDLENWQGPLLNVAHTYLRNGLSGWQRVPYSAANIAGCCSGSNKGSSENQECGRLKTRTQDVFKDAPQVR